MEALKKELVVLLEKEGRSQKEWLEEEVGERVISLINLCENGPLVEEEQKLEPSEDEMAVLVCEGNKLATSGVFARAAASYTRAILASGCSNKIKGEGNCQGSFTGTILAS